MHNTRPNVVLIVSEDHSQSLGCYGDPVARTPHLDALAAEGVRFANAHTTQSVCSPARASIHTGLYPHQCGQIGLATHNYGLYADIPNLPALMHESGYRTGMIGKLHINPESEFPLDFRFHEKDFTTFGFRGVRRMAEEAGTFFQGSAEQPFFLTVNYADAHLPFRKQDDGLPAQPRGAADVACPPFVGVDSERLREHVADYYNCMERLDAGVGMLLAALAESGHAEDTLVIFTTDHGAQLSRGKGTSYEGGLRIPLVARWPGTIAPGTVRDELVSHVDVLPTVLAAVGLPCPQHVVGESWLPLAQNTTIAWRTHLFAEWGSGGPLLYYPQRCVRDGRYKLIRNLLCERLSPAAWGYAGPRQRWEPGATVAEIDAAPPHVRRTYATFARPPEVELYDLAEDPWEFVNLAESPQHAPVRDELLAVLRDWQEQTGDGLADPQRLARLTAEHDDVIDAHYGDNPFGRSRDYAWSFETYLDPRSLP